MTEPDLFRVMDQGLPAGDSRWLPPAPGCTPRVEIRRLPRRRALADLVGVSRFAETRRALARAVQGVRR